jgi:2,3-diketo-5-methylthio-1-phosphopentane phosphatase
MPEPLAPLGPGDLVLSDFDGTIALADTGLEVITRLDLPEAWALEHRWRRGEIGSPECLAAQWALVRLPRERLEALLDALPLDPGFPGFVDLCRQRGVHLAILSDGLDLYLYRLLQGLGLRGCPGTVPLAPLNGCLPVFVNHAEWTPEGVVVEFPHAGRECADCGNCKTEELLALRPNYRRVLYLGDGYSDMCAARHADVLFAKSHLAEFCRREGLPFHPFANFAEITAALR